MEQTASLESLEYQVYLVTPVRTEPRAMMAQQDNRGFKELMVQMGITEMMAPLDPQVQREMTVQLGPLDRMVKMAKTGRMVCQELMGQEETLVQRDLR